MRIQKEEDDQADDDLFAEQRRERHLVLVLVDHDREHRDGRRDHGPTRIGQRRSPPARRRVEIEHRDVGHEAEDRMARERHHAAGQVTRAGRLLSSGSCATRSGDASHIPDHLSVEQVQTPDICIAPAPTSSGSRIRSDNPPSVPAAYYSEIHCQARSEGSPDGAHTSLTEVDSAFATRGKFSASTVGVATSHDAARPLTPQ